MILCDICIYICVCVRVLVHPCILLRLVMFSSSLRLIHVFPTFQERECVKKTCEFLEPRLNTQGINTLDALICSRVSWVALHEHLDPVTVQVVLSWNGPDEGLALRPICRDCCA